MKEEAKPKKTVNPKRKHVAKDLHELEHDELSGYESKERSLSTSSTDDNEDEGLGDGNMGRSDKNILSK